MVASIDTGMEGERMTHTIWLISTFICIALLIGIAAMAIRMIVKAGSVE